MSYKIIIYMTIPKECSICYEAFINTIDIEETIRIYKSEVTDKVEDYIRTKMIFGKSNRRNVMNMFLIKYYQKLWYPHYKQYKCSTENCDTAICGTCIKKIENKSDSIVFCCTHCRLLDWKAYMTKYIFPELIMVHLSGKCKNPQFSMSELTYVGSLY